MVIAFLLAAAQAAAGPSSAPAADVAGALRRESPAAKEACKGATAAEIVVCGHQGSPYRIDPTVLEASRARNALPPKPPVGADRVADSGCVGGQGGGCTNAGVVPLVGMAMVAVKAAELAAKGDDWRDPLRTHEDEYRLYKQAEERRRSEKKVRIFPSVGN